jgi:hypothetical protein
MAAQQALVCYYHLLLHAHMLLLLLAVCADGMWLDMTEAANFCSGMVCSTPKNNKTAMWGKTDASWQ